MQIDSKIINTIYDYATMVGVPELFFYLIKYRAYSSVLKSDIKDFLDGKIKKEELSRRKEISDKASEAYRWPTPIDIAVLGYKMKTDKRT